MAFYHFWEARNIAHYREPYRSYKDICGISLEETFREFGVAGENGDLIERYFAMFAEMALYPDVPPTLEQLSRTHRLALVSNFQRPASTGNSTWCAQRSARVATSRTGHSSVI